ncbi:3TM-type holin [Aminobacterium sp. MB27-C1]|uniref:3TM-type holin n=1 Tax=Aminobacterium sp. MB27-C1 TaxID=3070661 RepID=UPI0027DBBC3E|nr:3TM-type holin [Aminobacterium sp. MB27-C1]WMI72146.1 3TM-type holin [Aminobacterium sp. MB27-C1]
MNILEVAPVIGQLIDKVVPNPNQANELKIELAKLDIKRDIAKLDVQKAWLSNKSPYVAGAIPTILWMVSFVILFNHVVAPLLSWGFQATVPALELPGYYVDMASTIVIGLFVKKAWDNTDVKIGGFHSPVKSEVEERGRESPDYYKKRYEELVREHQQKEAST